MDYIQGSWDELRGGRDTGEEEKKKHDRKIRG